MLPEEKRIQLDSIVQKMIANRESEDNIKFVVDDFKQKYGISAERSRPDLLTRAAETVSSVFPGRQIGEAIGTQIAKLTVPEEQRQFVQPGPTAGQVAGDILKAVTTVAAPILPPAASLLGKVGQFGAIGGASGIAEAMTKKLPVSETVGAGVEGARTGAIVGGVLGLAEKGLSGLSKLLGKAGDKIMTTVIKPSQADIKDGFSIDTVKKYNLGGSLKKTFEKTDSTLDTLSKQLNEKLKSSNTSLKLDEVYEKTAKRLLGNKLESFGANAQMDNALEKLREEVLTVAGKNGIVGVPEAQIVKRAAGHFGAWTFGIPTPEATANQKVYNTFYNELKTAIEKASPEGVKEINKEISDLIPIMNALIRRIPVAERNSALSLTDIITLTGATLEPRALGLSLLNLASKSGSVGSLLSKTPNLGTALEKTEPIFKGLMAK